MGTMARRGGGLQMKVRGLRELLGSLKINYEAAMRSATTPEPGAGRRLVSGPGSPAALEQPVDQRAAHEDDHQVGQHPHQRRHEGQRAQDERGADGGEQDSDPVDITVSGAGARQGRRLAGRAALRNPSDSLPYMRYRPCAHSRLPVLLAAPALLLAGVASRPLAAQDRATAPGEQADPDHAVAGGGSAAGGLDRPAATATRAPPT